MFEDLLAQAEEQFVAGRFDAVADLCGELIAADPKSHQAYYLLGRTCLALGRSEEALEMIGRAVEIAPSAAPYHTELGNLLATTGDFERAAGAYFEAIRLAPDFIDPHV
ncbi:MAG: tetratricopeptide repeat protein, partial [Pseudomonadota bacterium]|nr:tetratricopeptide repeat protein [Pseudomonadota bacterium]